MSEISEKLRKLPVFDLDKAIDKIFLEEEIRVWNLAIEQAAGIVNSGTFPKLDERCIELSKAFEKDILALKNPE